MTFGGRLPPGVTHDPREASADKSMLRAHSLNLDGELTHPCCQDRKS